MRFIRVHGRVVPIKDGRGSSSNSKKAPTTLTLSARKVSAGERFKQGAKATGQLTASGAAVGAGVGALAGGLDAINHVSKMRNRIMSGAAPVMQDGVHSLKIARSAALKHIGGMTGKVMLAGAASGLALGTMVTGLHTAFGPRKQLKVSVKRGR